MRIALVALVALSTRAHAQCDPFSSSQAISIPKQLRLEDICGNGRIDTYATSCAHVVSVGCGTRSRNEDVCTKEVEVCDGRALANNSCGKLGFTGGQLRCASGCLAYDTSACTLCPPQSTCYEEHANEYANLRLMVQGEHVRVYWTQYKSLRVADVDLTTGALVNRRVVSTLGAIATAVGTSAMAIVGTTEKPELVIVNENGTLEQKPAPGGNSGDLLAAYDQPLAVIFANNIEHKPNVVVIDDTGAALPPTTLLAHDEQHTLLLIPLTAGSHRALWETYEYDFVANEGDALFVMRDTLHSFWVGVLRDGVVTTASPQPSSKASADVVLDGRIALTINATESVAFGVHHPVAVPKPKPMLGDLAYRGSFYVVQTKTVEVHAALIYEAMAIAVRKVATSRRRRRRARATGGCRSRRSFRAS